MGHEANREPIALRTIQYRRTSKLLTLYTWPIFSLLLRSLTLYYKQGIFQCYLDILTTNYAQIYPPDNVSLPPTQMFEVRIVIWKTKGTISD